MIDLAYPISESGSRYPTDPAPKITVVPARVEESRLKSGYTELSIRSHHGTHIDAPAHKIPGGKTIDQYELNKFINKAILFDLTPSLGLAVTWDYVKAICSRLLQQVLTEQGLQHIQQENISALLFRTGYENVIERWGDALHGPEGEFPCFDEDFNFPYIETEAAAFLVKACEERGIKLNLVGLDSFSIDPKGTLDSPAHRAFLSRDILILETLVHLDDVTRSFGEEPFELICPPVLYRGADAAQVRAFARALQVSREKWGEEVCP